MRDFRELSVHDGDLSCSALKSYQFLLEFEICNLRHNLIQKSYLSGFLFELDEMFCPSPGPCLKPNVLKLTFFINRWAKILLHLELGVASDWSHVKHIIRRKAKLNPIIYWWSILRWGEIILEFDMDECWYIGAKMLLNSLKFLGGPSWWAYRIQLSDFYSKVCKLNCNLFEVNHLEFEDFISKLGNYGGAY